MERIQVSLYAEDLVVRAGMAAMLRYVPDLEIHSVSGASDTDTPVLLFCADTIDEHAQLLDAIECGVTALVRRREATADRIVQAIKIAANLSYCERTIKSVLHGMMLRLDLRNRPHAVAYATREGFL